MSIIGKVFTPNELEQMAKGELGEDPKTRESDIKTVRSWLKKQPHLAKTAKIDDVLILTYLRGTKFSLQKTKDKLDKLHSVKGLCPEIFDNWDPLYETNNVLLKMGMNIPLRGYDKKGRKVILNRTAPPDSLKYSPEEVMRANMMITSAMVLKEIDFQAQVCGGVIIQDASGTTMGHVTQFSPAVGKKMMTIYEECFPSRPKAMFFLNVPGFVESLFNVMKGFMKEKMRERIFLLAKKDDFDTLIEEMGADILPREYGGNNGSLQDHIDYVTKTVEESRDWLMQESKYKSNEAKRPGKANNYSDIFGMEGSFRQLSID
eukprot:snap_masked-scaffold231_size243715-processed-gene-1.8 protein:Tk10031 transcript:snap_masked-scaffold231_size243715-processed-gene-1.8-mRNA-1 annotation:"hypothetical protein DAPPUDRAFT_200654"